MMGRLLMRLLTCVLAASTLTCTLSAAAQEKKPIATLTTAYTYLWADQGNHYRANLNGWNVRLSAPVGKGFNIFVSSTNYYGKNAKGAVNSHGYNLGAGRQVFATPHVKPNVFLEAGDVRSSNAGTITHQALVATGASFTFPIKPWVSLMVLPAEYVFLYPHSDWRNDYNAKVGLTFPIGHR